MTMALTMTNKISAKLLFYVSYLLHPQYPSYYLPTYLYFIYLQLRKLQSYYNVIPCPMMLIQYYIDSYSENSIDVNNTVIISKKMITNLKKNKFNFAFINSSAQKNDFRIVHFLTVPNIDGKDMLIPENLYHNIRKTKISNKMRLTSIDSKYIKIAKEVEVTVINTQQEISNNVIDMLLKNYFQTPRLLYKHDIFSINISSYAPQLACSNFQLLNVREVHFKCKKVSSEQIKDSLAGLFCINGETTLLQMPNVRCYLPLSLFKLCSYDNLCPTMNYENYLIPNCPYGLEKYQKMIEKAILPFIPKSKYNINIHKCSIILY